MSKSHASKGVVLVALAVNLTIAIFKTICAVITNSSAMISESIHSFVDCGNQMLMLVGMAESKRPATRQNPLGFHRSTYIYAFLVPTMIFIGGASTSLYEGLSKIIHPEPLTPIHAFGFTVPAAIFNLFVLTVSIVLEGFGLKNAWGAFRKSNKGSVLKAMQSTRDTSVLISMLEDSGAVIGLCITIVFTILTLITGNPVFDGLAATTVGILLLIIAWFLGRETKSLANGENNPAIISYARSLANDIPELTKVNDVMAIHLGPEAVLVMMSLDWEDNTPAGRIEQCRDEIDRQIRARFPIVVRLFVETSSGPVGATTPKPPETPDIPEAPVPAIQTARA